jgi:hypothetical protein
MRCCLGGVPGLGRAQENVGCHAGYWRWGAVQATSRDWTPKKCAGLARRANRVGALRGNGPRLRLVLERGKAENGCAHQAASREWFTPTPTPVLGG